jgi:hypothetical protein
MRPTITEHDASTGITTGREMTDEEYAALLASGWTETTEEPASETEETPSDSDAG